MRNTNTNPLSFGNVSTTRGIGRQRGLARHREKADFGCGEIHQGDTELPGPVDCSRIDAPSWTVLPVPRLVRMAGEKELGRGLKQRPQIRSQVSVHDGDSRSTQSDLAAPLETGCAEIVSGLSEVRHSVSIVIAKHKTEGKDRAGLNDVPSRQVTAMDERVGSGGDQNVDRSLRTFKPVVRIGEHSELHDSGRWAGCRQLHCGIVVVEQPTAHSAANDFADSQFQLVLRRQLCEALCAGALFGHGDGFRAVCTHQAAVVVAEL